MEADPPDERGQGEAETRRDAEHDRPAEDPDEVRGDRCRHGDAQAGEQVHPEGRLAERREQDVRDPAEQHERRVAGRVGRAEEWCDRLQLGGIPEPDARQHAHACREECDGADAERREPGS
jgi:hypothetical protein